MAAGGDQNVNAGVELADVEREKGPGVLGALNGNRGPDEGVDWCPNV